MTPSLILPSSCYISQARPAYAERATEPKMAELASAKYLSVRIAKKFMGSYAVSRILTAEAHQTMVGFN